MTRPQRMVRPLRPPAVDWPRCWGTALGIALGALVTLVMVESYRLSRVVFP